MRIALASDHAGFAEKERLKGAARRISALSLTIWAPSRKSPWIILITRARLRSRWRRERVEQGVLVCGSGTGMAITANKVPGVRAAVAWSEETARLARQHNDANVLAIGARTTPPDDIPKIVRAWFATEFEGGRHAARVEKISEVERSR